MEQHNPAIAIDSVHHLLTAHESDPWNLTTLCLASAVAALQRHRTMAVEDGDNIQLVWNFGVARDTDQDQEDVANNAFHIASVRRTMLRFEEGADILREPNAPELQDTTNLNLIYDDLRPKIENLITIWGEREYHHAFSVAVINVYLFNASLAHRNAQVEGGCLPNMSNKRLFIDGLGVYSSRSYSTNDCAIVAVLKAKKGISYLTEHT